MGSISTNCSCVNELGCKMVDWLEDFVVEVWLLKGFAERLVNCCRSLSKIGVTLMCLNSLALFIA